MAGAFEQASAVFYYPGNAFFATIQEYFWVEAIL